MTCTMSAEEPGNVRRFRSQIEYRIVAAQRHWALTRGLKKLTAVDAGAALDQRTLRKLTYGWGNETWASSGHYLQAVVRYVGMTRGAIVECGSGLSTLVGGTLARRRGRTHLALEHHPEWARRAWKKIQTHGLDNVQLHVCAIRSYDTFDWYELQGVEMPAKIGMIICDGPPGHNRGGRYGALPVLKANLAPGCVVLLDDTHREEERQTAQRWCAELGLRPIEEAATFTVLECRR